MMSNSLLRIRNPTGVEPSGHWLTLFIPALDRAHGLAVLEGCPGFDYVTLGVTTTMLGSSRFVIGIHVLAILARSKTRTPVCSTFIALSVNTNPVVIRRLMAGMERHGLVRSMAGRHGGFGVQEVS